MRIIVVWLIRSGDCFARFAEWLCDQISKYDPVYGFKCWEAGSDECTRIEKKYYGRPDTKRNLPDLSKE